jgi:hypothetical protein
MAKRGKRRVSKTAGMVKKTTLKQRSRSRGRKKKGLLARLFS